jgi:hypothetical protein
MFWKIMRSREGLGLPLRAEQLRRGKQMKMESPSRQPPTEKNIRRVKEDEHDEVEKKNSQVRRSLQASKGPDVGVARSWSSTQWSGTVGPCPRASPQFQVVQSKVSQIRLGVAGASQTFRVRKV